jgi:hypothetical protein
MNLPPVAPESPESVLPIALPAALDGRDGTNRARGGHLQIVADSDVEAVRLWLAEYAGSPHTLRSYRKEAVRLVLWATRTLGKPLSSLTREDFLLYEQFLAAPTGDWADPMRPRRGGTRRLFDGPLSERSRHQALGIVSGLLSYLVSAGYLAIRWRCAAGPAQRQGALDGSSGTWITHCGTTCSPASSSGRGTPRAITSTTSAAAG